MFLKRSYEMLLNNFECIWCDGRQLGYSVKSKNLSGSGSVKLKVKFLLLVVTFISPAIGCGHSRQSS